MATSKAVNKIAIEELKRSCDALSDSMDKLRVKTVTFIAGTFALLTYLYSSGDLFIPAELYGRIFYFVGLASILSSIAIFLSELRPHLWMLSTEIKQLQNIKQKTEEEYLEYVKGEYVECYKTNNAIHNDKHRTFYRGFILMLIGSFILVIIKTFPSSVQSCYTKNGSTCIVEQKRNEGNYDKSR